MNDGLLSGIADLIRGQGNLAYSLREKGLLPEESRRQLLADAQRARTELDRIGLIFAEELPSNVVRLADRRARR